MKRSNNNTRTGRTTWYLYIRNINIPRLLQIPVWREVCSVPRCVRLWSWSAHIGLIYTPQIDQISRVWVLPYKYSALYVCIYFFYSDRKLWYDRRVEEGDGLLGGILPGFPSTLICFCLSSIAFIKIKIPICHRFYKTIRKGLQDPLYQSLLLYLLN